MGLEAFTTFIEGLNTSNPVGATDNVSTGDDHIRGVKNVLKTTFAGNANDLYDEAVTIGPNVLNTQGKNNQIATAAPGVSNDGTEFYSVGSLWLDVTNDKAYICLDISTGAAVWQPLAPGSTTACSAGLTAAQAQHATPSTWDQILFNDVTGDGMFDLGGDFDISTDNEFVVPAGGDGPYAICGVGQMIDLDTDASLILAVYINGANAKGIKGNKSVSSSATEENCVVAGIRNLVATDTIQLWGKTSNAAGATWAGGADSARKTNLSIAKVG